MAAPLRRLVDPFNPLQGHLPWLSLAVRALRLTSVLVGLMVVPFGWAYHATGAVGLDPMGVRWAITATAFLVLVGSFWSRWIQRHAYLCKQVLVYALTGYFGWLAIVNGLSASYALGYYFVFVGALVEQGLLERRVRAYLAFLAYSMALAFVVALAVPQPDVPAPVFLVCIGFTGVIMFLGIWARMAMYHEHLRREARLAEAERLAHTGSWEVDLWAGVRQWSDGAYRLAGLQPTDAAPRFHDLLHPDDADAYIDRMAGFMDSGTRIEFRHRLIRADGVERVVHTILRLDRDRAGSPRRLVGVIQDVTAQVEREEELHRAKERAESADQAKSAFLANMSHEIRTPLTSIIGFAQMLGEDVGPEHRDLIEPIENGGRRLLDTLNSVLDLARMEAGEAGIQVEPVDAVAEAIGVVDLMRCAARQRGIEVEVEAPPALWVLADRGALTRTLLNLVSNAVKFTAQGRVTLRLAAGPAAAELVVEDTGRGMSADVLAAVFEPFRQASTGWARTHEGTGLGLTIVRRLVESMDGTVEVESEEGRGSRFTVRLPLAVPPAAPPMPAALREAPLAAVV